jgi:hypothetical protein
MEVVGELFSVISCGSVLCGSFNPPLATKARNSLHDRMKVSGPFAMRLQALRLSSAATPIDRDSKQRHYAKKLNSVLAARVGK